MDETRGYLAWGEAGQSKWAGTQNNDQQGFPTLGGWVVTWAGLPLFVLLSQKVLRFGLRGPAPPRAAAAEASPP